MMKRKLLFLLLLLTATVTGAWAQEQSETIETTSTTVNGTYFTVSSASAADNGMHADGGITVTAKNGEYIHKVVITCDQSANLVTADNTTVSSGTKTITTKDDTKTITVTGVYADTFTFTCSDNSPQFKKFVVYYFDSAPVLATGIALNKTSMDLDDVNDTVTLATTFSPANTTYKTVTWTSSDVSVATVSADGVVTAKGIGRATIFATATNGTADTYDDVKTSCVVTVGKIFYRMGSYNGEYVDWFVARSNSNGWMMLSKYVLKNMKFGSNSTYTQSNIYKWLDANAGGTFEDELGLSTVERSLVKTVDLSGSNGDGTDRFIIPTRSSEQPNGTSHTKAYYINNKSSLCGVYWLREERDATNPRVIRASDETVTARYSGPGNNNGVRPMFYMDATALAALTPTGSGTEDDPYVIEPRYDMTLNVTPAGKGTVTVTATRDSKTILNNADLPNKNVAGAVVTLTATPINNGYRVKNITVTSGGNSVALTGEGNTRTFTMPAADVTVELELEDLLTTDGTGAYLINSTADWEYFCSHVSEGKTYSGKTVKLTADVSGVTTRTGINSANPFSGTFDGQGHTLNLNINTTTIDDVTSAPFGYIKGATIQNLHITGSMMTTFMRPASIAGFAENSTITNCWSEVALTSSYNKDIDGGAFVATVIASSSLTLNGCRFTGTITYSNAAGYEGGGMVGYTRSGATATLNNCLFAPTDFTITKYSGHYMFVGGKTHGTLNNCYYNDVAAATSMTKQGKLARSITAGDNVTLSAVSPVGNATQAYNVSGITAYAKGIKVGETFYYGQGDEVSLTLSHGDREGYTFKEYEASAGTLSGTTLTMPDADVTISATWKKLLTNANITIADIADQTWNDGSAIEPSVTVKDGETDITAECDITFSNNTNTGEATVTITSKAESTGYTGSTTATFQIVPKPVTSDGGTTIAEDQTGMVATIDETTQNGGVVPDEVTNATLTYTRTIPKGTDAWTVCLPYNPPTSGDVKYYTLESVSGTTLNFTEVGSPQANTPYLVVVSANTSVGTSATAVDFSSTVQNPAPADGYTLKGTLRGLDHAASVGKYILQTGNKWGVVDNNHAGVYIPPFRAYIEATSSAPSLDSDFGGTTGIDSFRTIDCNGKEQWFDLNGRRLSGKPMEKGVYIQNGKKVVMK